MRKLDKMNISNLSFPDFNVKKMEFSAEKKTLKIFLDGAWLEENGGGMLGKGFLFFHNWESLTITIFDAATKTYSIVENTHPEDLEDICEFKFSDSTVCLCGFSEHYWMEWEINNAEMQAEFEPEPVTIKVTFDEIREMFDSLIAEKLSRAQVSDWATERDSADDEQNLEFEPLDKRREILKGIKYLMGVDLLDTDGNYLHPIQDFIDYRDKSITPKQ